MRCELNYGKAPKHMEDRDGILNNVVKLAVSNLLEEWPPW